MSNFTLEGFAAHLIRSFSSRTAPGNAPRAVTDTSDKGKEVLDFYLPNPHDPRRSISLTVAGYRGSVTTCALWFGPIEVAAALEPEDVVPAIEEIIAGHIVAIARYKTAAAYDDRRLTASGGIPALYQLPDDAERLAAIKRRLASPAGLWDKLTASATGVFEVYTWENVEVFER